MLFRSYAPTRNREQGIAAVTDPEMRNMVELLAKNVATNDIDRYYHLDHPQQGIVHVIGPELGITQPGMTVACGDSHTSTHGAFGAIAFTVGKFGPDTLVSLGRLVLEFYLCCLLFVAGVLAPILGLVHAAHKLESPVGLLLTVLLLMTVITGFIGRYLLAQLGRALRGRRSELASLRAAFLEEPAAPTQAARREIREFSTRLDTCFLAHGAIASART